MPTAESQDRRRNTDLTAANTARLQLFAERAAQDPAKLAKAVRTVRAAIDLELLTVDELTGEREKASA